MQYILLVRKCLRAYGLLCLGVYRLFDDDIGNENEVKGQRTLTEKRYVITHPPADFRLIDTDKVWSLVLFLRGREKMPLGEIFAIRNLGVDPATSTPSQHPICSLTIRLL